MISYANLNELMHDLSNNPDIIKEIDTAMKKNKLGKYDPKVLARYAHELRDMILDNLNAYYKSYTPIMHERTGQLFDMFNDVYVNVENGKAHITFKSDAYQINAVKSSPHMSFIPVLLNYGWNVGGSDNPRARSYFEYFEGTGFITDAIDAFNAKYGSQGITAEFIFNGQNVESMSNVPYL